MAAVKITFEDPNSPGNPGIERIYADGAPRACTDGGMLNPGDIQVGQKVCRPRESWLTVLTVENPFPAE